MKLQRCAQNPLLTADPARPWESGAVFNCGATLGEDKKIYLLYRAIPNSYTRRPDGGFDHYISSIGCATSEDGIHFDRLERPVIEPSEEYDRLGCEDPRVTRLVLDGQSSSSYWITYTALSVPAFSARAEWRVALASTQDFRHYRKHGVIIPGVKDKDAVLFPELVGEQIVLLHRIEPGVQLVRFDSLEQLIHPSRNFWQDHLASLERATLMKPEYDWESEKIGAGPPPIRTPEGWLLIYHGVGQSDHGFIYRVGAALLDLEDPSRVIARSPRPILEPTMDYEKSGDVPNVVFPEGVVVKDGELYLYYGGADKSCCLARAKLADLLDYLRYCS
ncbi:MAG TPA: glycosidase [Candidatus Fraserbacteria bacterium]|nr:glycosidase [Candidatus Fraserbacteria bacterium]